MTRTMQERAAAEAEGQELCLDCHLPESVHSHGEDGHGMHRFRGKNFGPGIVAAFLGMVVASYIEYGVTRDELLELVGSQYDGIVATLAKEGVEPGYGKLSDAAIAAELARIRRNAGANQYPDRDSLIADFEETLKRVTGGV